jgi:hypothetical protein
LTIRKKKEDGVVLLRWIIRRLRAVLAEGVEAVEIDSVDIKAGIPVISVHGFYPRKTGF